jgi:hypothetical protein
VSKLIGLSFESSLVGTVYVLKYWGDEIKENKIGVRVAHTWESGSTYRVLVGKLREKDHLEDVDIDGKIIMKSVLKK